MPSLVQLAISASIASVGSIQCTSREALGLPEFSNGRFDEARASKAVTSCGRLRELNPVPTVPT